MNAAYSEADRILTSAQHHAGEADPATYGQALALVGIGRAILALVDEVEQVGELLRERLPAPATTPCHSSSSGGRDAVPCLLPNGHDGWHKGLGAVWSGAIPVGPTREGTETTP